MKVTLFNLPDSNSLDSRLDPNLGEMYLSAILNKYNYECNIVDLSFFEKSQWSKLIESTEADLYGMTVYSASLSEADAVSKLIKSYHPESKIIFGGTHPTFCAPQVFAGIPEVDFISFGESEGTILELAEKFNQPSLHQTIRSLGIRTDNTFFVTNQRPLIKDLDQLPPPERSETLHSYTRKVDGVPSTSIMASRGCPYDCKFCCSKYFWQHTRFHSLARINQELSQIKSLSFNAVHFWDDTFTINPNFQGILESLKSHNFVFRCNGNLRNDNKKSLQALVNAGCREYSVGIESGDQRMLKLMNKCTTVERNKQVLQWTKEVGLPVKAFIMVGYPGETWESVQNTINFIKETNPEYYTIFNFSPLPGSDTFANPELYNIKFRHHNWDEYFMCGKQNEGGCTIDTEFMMGEEIVEARKMLIAELPPQKGKLADYYKNVKV